MNINKIIDYAKTFIGIPYTWWTGMETNDVFNCDNIPDLDSLKLNGINCAGFINILIQYSGKSIPKSFVQSIPRGGTGFWLIYFIKNRVLKKIDYKQKYAIGTLLFRTYNNIDDQGHLAIIVENSKLNSKIIHAYAEEYGGQVGISDMITDNTPKNYYEFIVYPKDWLNLSNQ